MLSIPKTILLVYIFCYICYNVKTSRILSGLLRIFILRKRGSVKWWNFNQKMHFFEWHKKGVSQSKCMYNSHATHEFWKTSNLFIFRFIFCTIYFAMFTEKKLNISNYIKAAPPHLEICLKKRQRSWKIDVFSIK